jgi:hypothetical protein
VEPSQSVLLKRRVLVDALTLCLQRSKICETVSADTVRSLLSSAIGELWREGEFRLETVWKILCQQPGLHAADVAPPLLIFKSFEDDLGVRVRLPEALAMVAPEERARLAGSIGVAREELARSVADLKAHAEDEARTSAMPSLSEAAAQARPEAGAPSTAPAPRASHRRLAAVLSAVALVCIGISLTIAFRETSTAFDLSDVSRLVQIRDGRVEEGALMATLTDVRWDSLPKEEQTRLATELFRVETKKGIHAITLKDTQGRVRAMVHDLSGAPQVMLR